MAWEGAQKRIVGAPWSVTVSGGKAMEWKDLQWSGETPPA